MYKLFTLRYLFYLIVMAYSQLSFATPVIEIEIRDHLFYPAEIEIPVDTKVKLILINKDSTEEEFESYEMNREKVIPANGRGIVFIGPFHAGEYPFFGEFFPKTAQGKVIVK